MTLVSSLKTVTILHKVIINFVFNFNDWFIVSTESYTLLLDTHVYNKYDNNKYDMELYLCYTGHHPIYTETIIEKI